MGGDTKADWRPEVGGCSAATGKEMRRVDVVSVEGAVESRAEGEGSVGCLNLGAGDTAGFGTSRRRFGEVEIPGCNAVEVGKVGKISRGAGAVLS